MQFAPYYADASTKHSTLQHQQHNTVDQPIFKLDPRLSEQMHKRKLLWGRKDVPVVKSAHNGDERNMKNNWESVKFDKDNDGNASSKFLRLMGAKNAGDKGNGSGGDVVGDDESVVKRQQMFSTMERQYEAARQVTHKMRGKGLGAGGPVAQKKYF